MRKPVKSASVRKAFEKQGLKVEETKRVYDVFCRVEFEGRECSWYENSYDDNAQCVHVKRTSEQSDPGTDWFPGFFPRSIKSAVSYVMRGTYC